MPSLSRNVVHEYDPKSVFHNQAINIPLLTNWIDELVSLTEKSLPVRNTPTTEQLVESLQRYDAVFRELMRQTGKYSVNITRMFAKTWTGTLNLMDYMVKSYHRYVTTTDHLQEQARQLLKQRAAQVASTALQKEEFVLERTALRAQIRTLQAEVDSMGATQRGMQRENGTLREIIDNYIKSAELSEDTWEILDEDGGARSRKQRLMDDDLDDDDDAGDMGRRKANTDATRKHLRNMNRLDIEMNEAVANVLKEEDRQRMLVSDLELLMAKNSERMKLYAEHMGQRVIQPPAPELVEMGVQVDEKYDFGTVTDLTDIQHQAEWDDAGSENSPPEVDFEPWSGSYTVIPFQVRKLMKVYPRVLRIPPIAWLMQSIFAIYMDKMDRDVERLAMGKPQLNMGPHVYDYFMRFSGLQSLADNQMAQFVAALNYHYSSHKRVELFCHQMGLDDTAEMPELDLRDTTFLIEVLRRLKKRGELKPEPAPKGVTTSLVFRNTVSRSAVMAVAPEVFGTWIEDGGQDLLLKLKAMPGDRNKGNKYLDIDTAMEVFIDLWCAVRITWEDHLHYLFHNKASTYTVLSNEQFANDHGLFERDSVLVNVNKNSSTDCSRRPIRMCQKQEAVVAVAGADAGADRSSSHKSHVRPMQVGNPSKEPVVDVLTRDDFIDVMQMINPYQDPELVKTVYDEAVQWCHDSVIQTLEQIWVRMEEEITGKAFYLNKKTGKTQWTCPYHSKTFRSGDIEEEAFLAILMQSDVLAKSPFLDLVHLAPKDLWPNSDMFLKQKEARILKEKAKEQAKFDAIKQARWAVLQEAEDARLALEEAEEERLRLLLEEEEAKKKKSKKKKKKGDSKAGGSSRKASTATTGTKDREGGDSRPGTAGSALGTDSRPGTADDMPGSGRTSPTPFAGTLAGGESLEEGNDGGGGGGGGESLEEGNDDDDDDDDGGSPSGGMAGFGFGFGEALTGGGGMFSKDRSESKIDYQQELKDDAKDHSFSDVF